MSWRETRGPVIVAPQTIGFGTKVIGELPQHDLAGQVTIKYLPDGLYWAVDMPANCAVNYEDERWECVMARSKSTAESIEKLMSTLVEEAKANRTLPDLMAAALKKMREADPKSADTALKMMIERITASLPEHQRQKFFEQLLAYVQPN